MTIVQARMLRGEYNRQHPTMLLMDFVHRLLTGRPLFPAAITQKGSAVPTVEPTLLDAITSSAAGREALREKGWEEASPTSSAAYSPDSRQAQPL